MLQVCGALRPACLTDPDSHLCSSADLPTPTRVRTPCPKYTCKSPGRFVKVQTQGRESLTPLAEHREGRGPGQAGAPWRPAADTGQTRGRPQICTHLTWRRAKKLPAHSSGGAVFVRFHGQRNTERGRGSTRGEPGVGDWLWVARTPGPLAYPSGTGNQGRAALSGDTQAEGQLPAAEVILNSLVQC